MLEYALHNAMDECGLLWSSLVYSSFIGSEAPSSLSSLMLTNLYCIIDSQSTQTHLTSPMVLDSALPCTWVWSLAVNP